ncbi:hypothetical protein CYY_006226 [Polysphondylium violaceum]|uniref:Peptidase M66 domain-containing protein n=1 Tax=Polysphondylium violaceum TaxID=133409 RepID=A0A8J4PSL9_9MYCE|nr:hypothetical protein CYY_006226 [Polysphondylium violaceum]
MYKYILLVILVSLSFTLGKKLEIKKLEAAQTNIIPAETGLSWTVENQTLHLVGNRETLLIIEFGLVNLTNAKVHGMDASNKSLGSLALLDPSQLPKTESNGTKYSLTAYSVLLPANWLVINAQVFFTADTFEPSDKKTLLVGCDSELDMYNLPFYLFGANESTIPFSKVSTISDDVRDELYNKWPISTLKFSNHAAKKIMWSTLVLSPNNTGPAVIARNKNDQRDGYEIMGIILMLLREIRSVNGESGTNNQIYAPIIWLNSKGKQEPAYGGLGGGNVGTGDPEYKGIYFHETGHSMSLPHAGENYPDHYPYEKGSLKGSTLGYDKTHNEFLSVLLPTESSVYKNCAKSRVLDANGKCFKQSAMQGGSGDQSKGYFFTMYADFECGKVQRYFEGITKIDNGQHVYDGGKIFKNSSMPSGYSRWDTIDKKYVEVKYITQQKGLYGFNNNLPIKRDIMVYTMIATVSLANTTGATQLYPPLYYKGGMIEYYDPTNATKLKEIIPNTSKFPWVCHASGCDWTIRAIYNDNSVDHYLLQKGLRSWFKPMGDISQDFFNPLKSSSLQTFVHNIPASKGVPSRYQILYTPLGFNGLPSNPTVMLDYSCSGQGESISCSPFSSQKTTKTKIN